MPNTHSGSKAINYPDIAATVWESEPLQVPNAIAGDVLGEITVNTLNPVIGLYGRESVLALHETEVAPGATYPRSRSATDDVVGEVKKYGHEKGMTIEELIRTDDTYRLREAKARMAYGHVALKREYRVANSIFNPDVWTGSDLFTDNSGSPWSTTSTNVFSQVDAAIEKVRVNTGMQPNALICSEKAVKRLVRNDDIQASFPGAARVTVQMIRDNLSALLGLDRLIVGSGIYNSANAGQDFSGSELWSEKYAMVAKVAETNMEEEPCLGRTLRLRANLVPDVEGISQIDTREGIEIMEISDADTDTKVVRSREWLDEMIIDSAFGHLMQIEA